MKYLLAPIAYLYGCMTRLRNWLFEHDLLHERQYDTPTICVGNLAVGGTGKTPHTEWIVAQLTASGRQVAILSRGYGRKTKGYKVVDETSTALDVGDEPLQMFHRFGQRVLVVVCEDRRRGIARITAEHSDVDVIVLDDAFQHRYVKPSVRLLLTDYSTPYYADHLLPLGRLRESACGAQRADIIIVTKCPADLDEEAREKTLHALQPLPHQRVYFSAIDYTAIDLSAGDTVTLVSGIANPAPLVDHLLKRKVNIARHLKYADHHRFTAKEIGEIEASGQTTQAIVTTSKDYARLRSAGLSKTCMDRIIVQDIGVRILFDQSDALVCDIQKSVNV